MIAMRLPVDGAQGGAATIPALSQAYRLMPLMFTEESSMFLRQRASQGCSQIRAQAVGKGLSRLISLTASAYLPSPTRATYPGISTPAGQREIQGMLWVMLDVQCPVFT